MTKQLKDIGPGPSSDPFVDVVAAIIAVHNINGHTPDDVEIAELLEEQGISVSRENIESIRARVKAAR